MGKICSVLPVDGCFRIDAVDRYEKLIPSKHVHHLAWAEVEGSVCYIGGIGIVCGVLVDDLGARWEDRDDHKLICVKSPK